MKKRLAEAEAIKQAQKKPQDNKAVKPEAPAEGVIDEWVQLTLLSCIYFSYSLCLQTTQVATSFEFNFMCCRKNGERNILPGSRRTLRIPFRFPQKVLYHFVGGT